MSSTDDYIAAPSTASQQPSADLHVLRPNARHKHSLPVKLIGLTMAGVVVVVVLAVLSAPPSPSPSESSKFVVGAQARASHPTNPRTAAPRAISFAPRRLNPKPPSFNPRVNHEMQFGTSSFSSIQRDQQRILTLGHRTAMRISSSHQDYALKWTDNNNVNNKFDTGDLFVLGTTISSTFVPVLNARGKVLQIPESFSCNGFTLHSAQPMIDQGEDSCLATYRVTLSPEQQHQSTTDDSVIVAKFATQDLPYRMWGRSVLPRDMLANEVRILTLLHHHHVPNIVPVLGACELESGQRVMVMPKINGQAISVATRPGSGGGDPAPQQLELSFANIFPSSASEADVELREQRLIRETFESVIGMLAAGVINTAQFHNLLVDERTGHVTLVDFGNARTIADLPPKQAAWMVPSFLRELFSMIPHEHEQMILPLLEDLLDQYTIPPQFATRTLILDLWNNRYSTASVLPQWRQLYGLREMEWLEI